MDKHKIENSCLHQKQPAGYAAGATQSPVYLSSAFAQKSPQEMANVFQNRQFGYLYTRISNPTITALEEKLVELENGVGSVACASGMAAISLVMLTLLKCGDEFISGNSLFGGTYSLFTEVFPRMGIKGVFVESTDVNAFEKAVTENTRAIFVEAIGNPKMDVPDIKAIASVASRYGIPVIVDATVVSPYIFQAKDFGADLVVHSLTKYMNGNGNAMGGAVVDLGTFNFKSERFSTDFDIYNKKFGKFAFLAKLRKQIFINLGSCLSPQNAYLILNGMETLGLRMERHSGNAKILADVLNESGKCREVRYPSLSSHPNHEVAKKQFGNLFGGLLCADFGNMETAFAFMEKLEGVLHVANIGDTRTLVLHPASTIYHEMNEGQRRVAGVTEGLVRISTGLEPAELLVKSFKAALAQI